jgi:glycerol-3-phosphate acyltransferase PlsY
LADVAYALVVGLLIIVAHADNLARLRAGTERRVGGGDMTGPGPNP